MDLYQVAYLLAVRLAAVAHKQSEWSIAQSIFNRQPPMYSFADNMERHLADSKNVKFHNRNMEKQIAYFRYADGSTMHLSGNVAYYSAPCTECANPMTCTCTLKFDLRKREYNGDLNSKSGIVIDTTETIEELAL